MGTCRDGKDIVKLFECSLFSLGVISTVLVEFGGIFVVTYVSGIHKKLTGR